MRKLALPLAGAVGALFLGVTGVSAQTVRQAASVAMPAVVTVTATDFAFEAPDTVAAGAVTLRLVNKGPDLHHIWLVRLDEGKTMADLHAAFSHHGPPPAWAHDVGGPNASVPGEESVASVVLTPGNYALICVIPAKDGVPHLAKGMTRALTVVPAGSDAVLDLPKPDLVLVLDDYSFTFDRPLTAGRHVIRVENHATQPHEVLIAQLAPGKTHSDLVAWVEKPEGPPPAKPIGGTTGFAPDVVNQIEVDFAPGRYALICFVPDAKDGRMHVVHGMGQTIEVAAK